MPFSWARFRSGLGYALGVGLAQCPVSGLSEPGPGTFTSYRKCPFTCILTKFRTGSDVDAVRTACIYLAVLNKLPGHTQPESGRERDRQREREASENDEQTDRLRATYVCVCSCVYVCECG